MMAEKTHHGLRCLSFVFKGRDLFYDGRRSRTTDRGCAVFLLHFYGGDRPYDGGRIYGDDGFFDLLPVYLRKNYIHYFFQTWFCPFFLDCLF